MFRFRASASFSCLSRFHTLFGYHFEKDRANFWFFWVKSLKHHRINHSHVHCCLFLKMEGKMCTHLWSGPNGMTSFREGGLGSLMLVQQWSRFGTTMESLWRHTWTSFLAPRSAAFKKTSSDWSSCNNGFVIPPDVRLLPMPLPVPPPPIIVTIGWKPADTSNYINKYSTTWPLCALHISYNLLT